MKTMIAVQGVANVGKSTSIRYAYDLLRESHSTETFESILDHGDIDVVITIKGIKVGITSKGDPSTGLSDRLTKLVDKGCKVIICSARTSGDTDLTVKKFSKQYWIKWIYKSPEPNDQQHIIENRIVAKEIIAEVQSALNA